MMQIKKSFQDDILFDKMMRRILLNEFMLIDLAFVLLFYWGIEKGSARMHSFSRDINSHQPPPISSRVHDEIF